MAMTLNASEQERLNNVYNEREKALAENNSMYEGLINQAGEMKNSQNAYLAQQEAMQNQAIDDQLVYQKGLIDTQKQEAEQNKRVEENKAINDYQSYINPYGLQNERLYSAGLGNSGVSETSKLGAYTVYQNRVSAANSALQKAYTDYDNAYNQAVNEGNVQKAQNALTKLKLEIQNEQDYFNNVSSLTQKKLSTANSLTAQYTDQYNTIYNQIMKEQAEAEAVRQWEAEQRLKQQQLSASKGGSSGSNGSGRSVKLTNGSGGSAQLTNGQSAITNTTELYQWMSPNLSGKDKDWYNNKFDKHSYATKDLIWVLDNAVKNGQLSEAGAETIFSTYSKEKPVSIQNNTNNNSNGKFFKDNAVTEALRMLNPTYAGYKVGNQIRETFGRLFGKK